MHCLATLWTASSRSTWCAAVGKQTTGKGCLYIRRLADVDQAVLRELVERLRDLEQIRLEMAAASGSRPRRRGARPAT
jgi:hypothetical protein